MKTDGIILDIDGTLWNSTDIVAEAWNEAIRSFGISETRVDGARLRGLFGRTMDAIAADIFPEMEEGRRLEILDACTKAEEEALERDPCDIFYPGVIDTIHALKEKGQRLFIVSNCQQGYIELVMQKGGFAACIADHLCFGDTGKGKDENIRLLVAKNGLKTPFYVGDTQGDSDAAAAAGVPFVFASYGFGDVSAYNGRIGAFAELMNLVSF